MRIRGDSILVTLYNLENRSIEAQVKLAEHIKTASEIKVDGTIIDELPVLDNALTLTFEPREIKMCSLGWQ